MHINLVYDAFALQAPQSFRDGMETAARMLEAALSDDITINISVHYGNPGDENVSLGGANANNISYTTYRNALAADATTSDDATALASLTTDSSVEGVSTFVVARAQQKALGLLAANDAGIDGAVTMGTGFTGNALISGALHEITHAMGRLPGYALDLYRYSGIGTHVFSGAVPAPSNSYFSIDGGLTAIADFGVSSDPGDFLNPPASVLTINDPFNESVGNLGSMTDLDVRVMDVLGFNYVSQPFTIGDDIVTLPIANHTWEALDGADIVTGTPGADTVKGGGGTDTLMGQAGADHLWGEDGNDLLKGGGGADELIGGPGNDTISYQGSNFVDVDLQRGSGRFGDAEGDTFVEVENIIGSSSGDVLRGDAANNEIRGEVGNDLLEGRGGADHLVGGDNVDSATYASSSAGVIINLLTNTGTGGDAEGDTFETIENLIGSNFGDWLTGDDNPNVLEGGRGNDLLGGLGSYDTLVGGLGNDVYFLYDASRVLFHGPVFSFFATVFDVVSENSGEGIDTVHVMYAQINPLDFIVGYTLGANIENGVIDGTLDFDLTGNELDNTIAGNAASNVLDGAGGFDLVSYEGAGAGVIVDLGPSSAQNTGGGGIDTLLNFEGIIGSAWDDILLRGFVTTAKLYGGGGDDIFHDHNFGNDLFDGGAGRDTVSYVTGNLDSVVVDLGLGTAVSIGGSVNTLVRIENAEGSNGSDMLLGNGVANWLFGLGGDDTLNGRGGADSMEGGDGDDTYYVDVASDKTVETSATGGNDTVISSVSRVLGPNLENLALSGGSDINGTGNELDNIIKGNTGANVINGGTGADTMSGNDGADTYVVDNTGDVVKELLNQGTDLVKASISYVLTANVENLLLTGNTAINGTGNSLANSITGNGGSNVINGAAGADVMQGGNGADTYFVDDAGDLVSELLNQGTDLVRASITYALTANVEDLILTGTGDISGTGNTLANKITGNSGANILNGASGADNLRGGGGSDTLDGGADVDVLSGGLGNDTFVFHTGEADGDRVSDFASAASGGGDQLQFVGYGVGATLSHVAGATWQISYGLGLVNHEQIFLSGITTLGVSDFHFV